MTPEKNVEHCEAHGAYQNPKNLGCPWCRDEVTGLMRQLDGLRKARDKLVHAIDPKTEYGEACSAHDAAAMDALTNVAHESLASVEVKIEEVTTKLMELAVLIGIEARIEPGSEGR